MRETLLLTVAQAGRKTPITYSITGNIADAGATAIEDVTVALSGDATDSTTTDASGDYAFTGLSDGTYTVTPTKTGYIFTPTDDEVVISGGDDTSDFVAAAVWTISGSITDSTAAALPGVTVALSGDASDSTTTDGSGNYSFTGVVDGSYTVTPTLTGFTFSPASRAANVSGGDVALDAMADDGNLVLPFFVNFGDFTTGAPSEAEGLFKLQSTAAASTIVATNNADSNSYTPTGVSKNIVAASGAYVTYGYKFPYGKKLASGLSSVRVAALFYDDNDNENMPYIVLCENTAGQEDIIYNALWSGIFVSVVPNAYYSRQFLNGSETFNYNNTGGDHGSTRWSWNRATWSTSGNQVLEWYIVETATTENNKTQTLALSSVRQFDMIGFRSNAASAGNMRCAGLWIGASTDAWPTTTLGSTTLEWPT